MVLTEDEGSENDDMEEDDDELTEEVEECQFYRRREGRHK